MSKIKSRATLLLLDSSIIVIVLIVVSVCLIMFPLSILIYLFSGIGIQDVVSFFVGDLCGKSNELNKKLRIL